MKVTIDPTGSLCLSQPELNETSLLASLKSRLEFFEQPTMSLLYQFEENTSCKHVSGFITAGGTLRRYDSADELLPLAKLSDDDIDIFLYPHDITGFRVHHKGRKHSAIWVGKVSNVTGDIHE